MVLKNMKDENEKPKKIKFVQINDITNDGLMVQIIRPFSDKEKIDYIKNLFKGFKHEKKRQKIEI